MRLRREPELDPDTIRELEALDAALAGRPVAPQDEELAALAIALRDERPQPRPQFALDLDLRAREGFETTARAPRAARQRRRRPTRRSWGLALGTAASVFIVATGVIGSGVLDSGGGEEEQGNRSPALSVPPDGRFGPLSKGSAPSAARGESAERQAQPQPSTAAPAPPSGGDVAARARDRKVVRGASLTLAPPRDRIEEVADDAIKVTDQHGGFVFRSVVTAGEGSDAGAALELRIPSPELQPALADLSELAHVRARTQQTTDITAAFRSPRRRLADALAERRALLRQLARAVTANETAAVRARLRAVNRRIDRAQAELRRLRDRVSFSAVSLAIEPGSGKAADGGGWSIGDAVDDALSVLRTMLGAALVALAVLIPASLLAAFGWVAYRAWVRRRRESALEM
jgi:Domain of unknown function (DUF4349)